MFVLNRKVKITRPIIFLCGPYYEHDNKEDRRKIFQDFFKNNFNDKFIPLVIDDFLTKENINDESINVQLLEEIFAAISTKTYIFLDTMSSATELGLFSNNSFSNKVQVYLPERSDILNKSNVGYFVRDIVLKHNEDRIGYQYYRPKIMRRPIATDFVVEHYGFINDKVPSHIAEGILGDTSLKIDNLMLTVENLHETPSLDQQIYYTLNNDVLEIKLTVKMFFYITTAATYKIFQNELVTKTINEFSDADYASVYNMFMGILKESVCLYAMENREEITDIKVSTVLTYPADSIVKHIMKFILTYHNKSRFSGLNLTLKDDVLRTSDNLEDSLISKIGLDLEDINLIKNVLVEKEKYYVKKIIRTGSKKRTILTYREKEGDLLKELHKRIVSNIEEVYVHDENSYAYCKGKSIKDCVDKHIASKSFIKLDVRKFFNSINTRLLEKKICENLSIDKEFSYQVELLLNSCSVNDSIPLGLITSPVLSDIYLKDFDIIMKSLALEYNMVYTRYADDLLLSKETEFREEEIQEIVNTVESELKREKLSVNKQKTFIHHLKNEGDHMKFLGINIVLVNGVNKMSVGRNYINKVAKEYLRYLEAKRSDNIAEGNLFYKSMEISGMISFIKQIEGQEGFAKVVKRISKSTQGRMNIEGEHLPF